MSTIVLHVHGVRRPVRKGVEAMTLQGAQHTVPCGCSVVYALNGTVCMSHDVRHDRACTERAIRKAEIAALEWAATLPGQAHCCEDCPCGNWVDRIAQEIARRRAVGPCQP